MVQPITKEVTLPAEFGGGRFEDPRVEVFGKLSTSCVGAGQSDFNSSNLSSSIQVLEDSAEAQCLLFAGRLCGVYSLHCVSYLAVPFSVLS